MAVPQQSSSITEDLKDQPEIDLPLERDGGRDIRKEMSRNSPSVIHT